MQRHFHGYRTALLSSPVPHLAMWFLVLSCSSTCEIAFHCSLLCISLMRHIKHFSMCSLTIYITSSVKCLFNLFTSPFIEQFILYYWIVSSLCLSIIILGHPSWLSSEESTCQTRDMGSIPRLERDMGSIPGEGNGNPLEYSCLGNLMDREAWWATLQGVARVGRDLMTKPSPPHNTFCKYMYD